MVKCIWVQLPIEMGAGVCYPLELKLQVFLSCLMWVLETGTLVLCQGFTAEQSFYCPMLGLHLQ